jgi:WD40 repeat protein
MANSNASIYESCPEDWNRLENILERFETALLQGQRPDIRAYLPADEPGRSKTLVELVHAELEYRLKAGEPARVEEYLTRYPDLARKRVELLGLIAAEYALRRRGEPNLGSSDYVQRFPEYAEELLPHLKESTEGNRPETPPQAMPTGDHPGETGPDVAHQPVIPAHRQMPVPVPAADTGEASWPGIPGYEILGKIASGGMGLVYKARQVSLNRIVALKMIRSGIGAMPDELTRFRREAEAAAHVQHPNIVHIYEIGELQGCPYFSLEYVDGGNLAQKLAGALLPARQTAQLLETLARAVHHAHLRGVIHRDLKPANVLLTADGTPKVADFGLAKHLEGAMDQTRTGAIIGTPSYMAPEQAAGQKEGIGPAADVYALGTVLYEMLTGRPPFKADSSLETLLLVRTEEPVPPTRLQPKCPRDLETICLKCLRKAPGKRYADAEALAEDLRRFLAGEPILAHPPGLGERCFKWVKRRPATAALLGVSTAAAVALLTVVLANNAELKAERNFALVQKQKAEEAEKQTSRALQASHQQLVHFHVANGVHLLEEGDLSGSLPWFAEALTLDTGDPAREKVHRIRLAAVLRQCPPLLQVWPHSQPVKYAAFDQEGKRVVTACDDGLVRIWDTATGKQMAPPLKLADKVRHAAFSPDGRCVAIVDADGTARIWHLSPDKHITLQHEKAIHRVSFSPDGLRVVTVNSDATAQVWQVTSGQRLGAPLMHTDRVLSAVFSPDGRQILTASADGLACLWDGNTSRKLGITAHLKEVWHGAFSPEGRRVVTACENGAALVWEVGTGRSLATLVGHPDGVRFAAFSPAGDRVVTTGADRAACIWAVGGDGQPSPRYPLPKRLGHKHFIQYAAFSPDGRYIVTASEDQTARVWDAATGQPVAPPLNHGSVVWHAAFSPDGTRLVTASHDGLTRLWDLTTRRNNFPVLAHEGEVNHGCFSPDGRLVVTASDDGSALVWDALTGQPAGPAFRHGAMVLHAVFSPDGRRVVTSGTDGTARVWNVATGRAVTPPLKHRNRVFRAFFSPDGRRVVTASADFTARVWDATTGQPLTPPLKHGGGGRRAYDTVCS